jgi:hypothetical protein
VQAIAELPVALTVTLPLPDEFVTVTAPVALLLISIAPELVLVAVSTPPLLTIDRVPVPVCVAATWALEGLLLTTLIEPLVVIPAAGGVSTAATLVAEVPVTVILGRVGSTTYDELIPLTVDSAIVGAKLNGIPIGLGVTVVLPLPPPLHPANRAVMITDSANVLCSIFLLELFMMYLLKRFPYRIY